MFSFCFKLCLKIIIFKNIDVQSDFGPYDKEFDDECRDAFQALPQEEKDKYGYEYELMILLERLVQQCDQRVNRHAERIRADHLAELEEIAKALTEEEMIRFGEVEDEIARIEGGADVKGSALALIMEGRVDEAVSALNRTEALKREVGLFHVNVDFLFVFKHT
jgi:RNA-binding protein Luc7-like 2